MTKLQNTRRTTYHHSTQRRRKKNSLPIWKRVVRIVLGVLVCCCLLCIAAVVLMWYYGWLPARIELPQFKQRWCYIFSQNPNIQVPNAEVIGIDISHYQSYIDWDEVCLYMDKQRRLHRKPVSNYQRREIDFVVAKATQGTKWQDSFYKRNKAGAAKQNILFGAYHFYSPTQSAIGQANNFIQTADLQKGDIVPILDVELYNDLLPHPDSVLCWLKQIEAYYGAKPIIYTNENCYKSYFQNRKELCQYHFWIARYGEQQPDHIHLLWQFTETGIVSGIGGYTDINILRGTKEDLFRKCTIQ